MRRSTSSVSRDCAPWALSDPTWGWQRFYSGSQDTEVSKRSSVLRKAQEPPESHGGIGIVGIFPMPTQVNTDHLMTADWDQFPVIYSLEIALTGGISTLVPNTYI